MYGNRGPCLDVGVRQDILAELGLGNTTTRMAQHVVEERFADMHGGVFREFDRIYRGQGGTDGGWESSKDKP